MKKFIFTLVLLFGLQLSNAQSKYEAAMGAKIEKFSQENGPQELEALSHDFARIGSAEKTQWLPFYYASLAQIVKGRTLMMQGQTKELDPIADAAQGYLDQASALEKDNAELHILQKMIHGLRLMVSPAERYMTEGPLGAASVEKARKIDPENPRITLLEAQDIYFTPEAFGGSKSKGLELFQKSVDQFKAYKIKSPLMPNWGESEAQYFITNKP